MRLRSGVAGHHSLLLLLSGTVGLAQAGFAGSEPLLNGPIPLPDGQAEVQVVGHVGTNYVLQGSADLAHWLDLAAATATNGLINFVDPFGLMAPSTEYSPDRFYRVREGANDEIPNPINATVAADVGTSVTAEVNLSGGSLALTNSDGTICQLQFPAENPLDLEEITLTVITNVSGLPVTRPLLAAVSLAPEDLPLIGEPTLTITRPGGFPSGSVLGFSYQGAGNEFHPYPARLVGNQLSFHIHQFGGFGALQADPVDAAAFQQRTPTSLEDRIEQQVALILFTNGVVAGSSRQPKGGGTAQDAAYAAESQFLNLVVDTELIIAETDEAMFGLAMITYQNWYIRVEDEGIADRFAAEIAQANQYVVVAFENSVNRKSQRCDQHDLDQIVRMVNAGRIMGRQPWAPAFTPAIRQDLEDKIRRCATFQVDFDSLMINSSSAGIERSRTHADITVQYGSPISHLTGPGTLVFTETTPFSIPPPCAPITAVPVSAPFNIPYCVLHLQMALDNLSPTNHWQFKDATVDLTLPMVHEGYYTICDGYRAELPDFWYPEFGYAHQDELTAFTPPGGPPEGVFQIKGWTPVGGAVIATKTYQRTMQFKDATVEEQTTLTLRHTPSP